MIRGRGILSREAGNGEHHVRPWTAAVSRRDSERQLERNQAEQEGSHVPRNPWKTWGRAQRSNRQQWHALVSCPSWSIICLGQCRLLLRVECPVHAIARFKALTQFASLLKRTLWLSPGAVGLSIFCNIGKGSLPGKNKGMCASIPDQGTGAKTI